MRQFQRTKQCVGLDCQKWTVTAWSKVKITQLLPEELKNTIGCLLKRRSSKTAFIFCLYLCLCLQGCGLNSELWPLILLPEKHFFVFLFLSSSWNSFFSVSRTRQPENEATCYRLVRDPDRMLKWGMGWQHLHPLRNKATFEHRYLLKAAVLIGNETNVSNLRWTVAYLFTFSAQ